MSDSNVNEQSNKENHEPTKSADGTDNSQETKPRIRSQISMVELDRLDRLDRMVADSLKDIDVDDDDGDDDDPELLNELSQIIQPEQSDDTAAVNVATTNPASDVVPLPLKERIQMYKTAETNAISANESGRARRFARGLSTLETMMKEILAGKSVNLDEMPPEVITGEKNNPESVKKTRDGDQCK